jgi:hypothetical protein
VGGVGRGGLECVDHDGFDHVVADGAGRSRSRSVDQPVNAISGEAVPPLRHRHRVAPQLGGDLGVGAGALGARQHDAAPQRQRLRRRLPSGPALERLAFIGGEADLDGGSAGARQGKLLLSGVYLTERARTAKVPDLPIFLG